MLDGRKQSIVNHLSRIDNKLRDINKNCQLIEEKIYQLFKAALFQLQQESQKKVKLFSLFILTK
jgi:hypothetical protein